MAADQPREGRQLPGAITSNEERRGLEPVGIRIIEGQVELDQAAAPAGDVRIVVNNRGREACGLQIGRLGRPGPAVWRVDSIGPGDSAESIIELEEGDYAVTAIDGQGARRGEATLVVQPQQGLAGSGEPGAAPA